MIPNGQEPVNPALGYMEHCRDNEGVSERTRCYQPGILFRIYRRGTNRDAGLVFEEGSENNDINDLTVIDPLTLRPLVAAKVKLEVVYKTE